ncbi:MAG TPA: SDR family oxidoreductase, partial [Thermoleophilia bacterium]|nr:SDR family oxidoreductase [Thermoleophilia bacterium]
LAKHAIWVNSVSPGYVETPMVASVVSPRQLDYMRDSFERVPWGRLVLPEEIAAAILFLCSGEASAVTGTDLIVDCGTLANSYIGETLPPGPQAKRSTV